MPQSPGRVAPALSESEQSTRSSSAMRDCSEVSPSASGFGSAERKRWRKKSHVADEVVVTTSEGPAARKKGTRDGGR